jgi:hypothetical protein
LRTAHGAFLAPPAAGCRSTVSPPGPAGASGRGTVGVRPAGLTATSGTEAVRGMGGGGSAYGHDQIKNQAVISEREAGHTGATVTPESRLAESDPGPIDTPPPPAASSCATTADCPSPSDPIRNTPSEPRTAL